VRRPGRLELGEFPAGVDRVLHAEADPLPAGRRMDVRGVAGEQHPPTAVGGCVPGGVGEPGDLPRILNPEVRAVHGRQCFAEVRQGRLARGSELLLGHDDPYAPPVLHHVHRMDADVVKPDASGRVLGHLDLGDQVAAGRLRPDELDAGHLADDTAPTICTDQVRRTQRPILGEVDVDAGVVLGEASDLEPTTNRHAQLLDPAEQDPLEVALPQPQRVRVPGGQAADVQ